MNLKEQVSKNAAAGQQAACTPSGCKACQRKGIAIYPLRVAVAPKPMVNTAWKPVVPTQEVALSGGEFKYVLRTLRAGYVYVLMDRKIWQGYQVTAEGYLRQFNVYEMPEGEKIESLSPACLTQNHDILTSFINIDPIYKEVMVAFSNDPWSKKVLDEYKSGKRPATRFTHLTIDNNKTCTADPNRCLRLDPSLAALKRNVLEFATDSYPGVLGEEEGSDGKFGYYSRMKYDKQIAYSWRGGAFGFYSRMNKEKQAALGGRLAHLQQQYDAPVNAIVLDDTVGIVQELNYVRMNLIEALAKYTSKPETIHQSTISDAILKIREAVEKGIEQDTKIESSKVVAVTPSYLPNKVFAFSREENVAEAKRSALKRLQKFYNESQREYFAKAHKATVEHYHQKMAAVAKDIENWYRAASWLMVIRQDYSPETCLPSWAGQLVMLAGCLQGSTAGMDKEKTIWKIWMETPDSPPYMSILGKAGLVNDVYFGSETFGHLKTIFTSEEVSKFINSQYFDIPASQLTMSISGAFSQLGEQLSEKARKGFEGVLLALAFFSKGGPEIMIFSGKITIRQYQEIMNQQLGAYGQPVWNILRNGQSGSHTGIWPQVTDLEILEQKIHARFAVLLRDLETPEFKEAARKAGTSPQAMMRGSRVKSGSQLARIPGLRLVQDTLDKAPVNEMSLSLSENFKIVKQQYQLSRRAFSSNGLGLVLGAVMMGLQVSTMHSNIKELKKDINNASQSAKVVSDLLIVTALGLETFGNIHMVSRWGTNPWALNKGYVHPLIRIGGVIGAIGSIISGFEHFMLSDEARGRGNNKAANLYFYAGISMVMGGVAGGYAALVSSSALFGPVGLSLGLLILGTALAVMAANKDYSLVEVWLSNTCFGIKDDSGEHDYAWKNVGSLSDLKEAMNAFYAIARGVSVELRRDVMARALHFPSPTMIKVTLPECSKRGSDWLIELIKKDGTLLCRGASPDKSGNFIAPFVLNHPVALYEEDDQVTGAFLPRISEKWGNDNLLVEGTIYLDSEYLKGAELKVTYWPDKALPDSSLRLSVTTY